MYVHCVALNLAGKSQKCCKAFGFVRLWCALIANCRYRIEEIKIHQQNNVDRWREDPYMLVRFKHPARLSNIARYERDNDQSLQQADDPLKLWENVETERNWGKKMGEKKEWQLRKKDKKEKEDHVFVHFRYIWQEKSSPQYVLFPISSDVSSSFTILSVFLRCLLLFSPTFGIFLPFFLFYCVIGSNRVQSSAFECAHANATHVQSSAIECIRLAQRRRQQSKTIEYNRMHSRTSA